MCFVVMDPLVLLHQKGALSREQDQHNVMIDACMEEEEEEEALSGAEVVDA